MKKDHIWKCTEEDTLYMDRVKAKVKNLPTLYHLGPDDKMIIETDIPQEY